MRAPLVQSLGLALALGAIAALAAADVEHPEPGKDLRRDDLTGTTGPTGAVDEEQFKAMHDLKTEKAPPALGAMIDLPGGQAYLSLPPGAKAPLPALVVIHEWWGLNDNIKHWTDRLAAEGYAALAVDLYGGKVATTPDSAMAFMKAVDDQRALAIMRAAHDYLKTNTRIRAARTGSIGWCFGGGMSLKLALAEPELDAAVIYYGRLVTDPKELAAIKAAVLGVFGNKDESIPPAVVNDFDAALTAAKVPYEIRRYDANHAFANPSAASYDHKNAGAAWSEVKKFLAAHLLDAGK
jgi:carboxymethylenebutenolidase